MKRLSLPNYVLRSGASFEDPKIFIESSQLVDTNAEDLSDVKRVGIPIAQIDRDTYATTKDELHCFVIGESGSGKTRRVILPSIRLLAKSGESMVISDPKGELYKYTAAVLESKGYDVRVLNFRNPGNGDRWNPLHLIEMLYKAGTIEEKDRAAMMCDDLVSIISDRVKDQNDQFWTVSASNFFRGIVQIILEFGNEGELTFENIAIMGKKVFLAYSSKNRLAAKDPVKSFIESLPISSSIRQNLSCITNNAEETRSSVNTVFEGMISPYCNQELLLDLFCKSEIEIESIGKKPTALFFILPDDSDAMYPVATYFVKQVYSTMINLADAQPDGKLPNKVTFLLDEFANFTKLPTMHSMLTAARSRDIRFVLVCQSMEQLSQKYGSDGMEILISNCRVWIYMKCRNLPFLNRLRELAGEYISPYTGERHPLLTIDGLQHFRTGQVLVFNDCCRPLIGYLEDYSKYDFGAEGKGELSDFPKSHDLIERKLFSWEDAIEKSNPEPKTETFEEVDFGFFLPTATEAPNRGKKVEGPDIDALISDIDKKIHEMEVSEYIEKLSIEGISEGNEIKYRNNLAYIIRHHNVDVSKQKAPFDLSVPKLLEKGVKSNHIYSVLNLALYHIENGNYEDALKFIRSIDKEGFVKIMEFWHEELWLEDEDVEGAFVSYLCYRAGAFAVLSFGLVIQKQNWEKKISTDIHYSEFLKNKNVEKWLSTFKAPTDFE